MNAFVIQQVEVILLMEYLAVFRFDLQLTQVIFVQPYRAVRSYQEVAQQVAQWIILVAAKAGGGKEVLNAGHQWDHLAGVGPGAVGMMALPVLIQQGAMAQILDANTAQLAE